MVALTLDNCAREPVIDPDPVSLRVSQRAKDDTVIRWTEYPSWGAESRLVTKVRSVELQHRLASALLEGSLSLADGTCGELFHFLTKEDPHKEYFFAGIICGRAWTILELYDKAIEAFSFALNAPRRNPDLPLQLSRSREICAAQLLICFEAQAASSAHEEAVLDPESALLSHAEVVNALDRTDEMAALTMPNIRDRDAYDEESTSS